MRLAIKYTLATVLVMLFAVRSYADDAPMKVVSEATNGVIKELIKTSPEDRDPKLVERLVANYILPAIDQEKIAMGALGKYWRRATPEEQQRFITIFRERQMKTYGGAFKAFSGETLTFSETRYSPDGERAIVKGEFTQSSGSKVPVDFRLYLDKDSDQWLVYDAVISGLSMVKTYRTQLSDRLQNISIAELLIELETEPVTPVTVQDS
jgi:phospholipid transport system substrate-binding protein